MNDNPQSPATNARVAWSAPKLLLIGDATNVLGGGIASSDGSGAESVISLPTSPIS